MSELITNLCMKIPFLGTIFGQKKCNLFLIRADGSHFLTKGYDCGSDIIIEKNGKKYPKKSFYSHDATEFKDEINEQAEFYPIIANLGEINIFFVKKLNGKTIFIKSNLIFNETAKQQVLQVDTAKMADRESEKIYFTGLDIYKRPMPPEVLMTVVFVGAILIILFFIFLSNFPNIVSILDSTARQAPVIINETIKQPIVVGG